ncbi:MAG: M1 family metallopeptidase [Bacteroidota bacterium]
MRHKIYRLFFSFFLLLIPFACNPVDDVRIDRDPHSYAQAEKAVIRHLDLDIKLDFEGEILKGTAVFEIEKKEDATEIILDTKQLSIESVSISQNKVNPETTSFQLDNPDEILGQALRISLKPDTRYIHVQYATQPGAEALQFLPANLTTDKKAPFLLTQSQPILARSWVPCQDSPAIRFSYNARVEVPKGLMAVMSASNPQSKNEDGIYEFEMQQKIPAYLLALAVGDFDFKEIGNICGVYAEASVLDAAADEFADLPEMIRIAENMYGSYEWERYDVIVLPASFPFGGMENPRITFVTPTVLAGDRSLVSLLAHELAHSWSGNLVTNASWNDFWLNEGFTVYFENRIMEELEGKDYSDMLEQICYQELSDEWEFMRQESPEDSRLAVEMEGRNPDDNMTSIPYNKGFYFLKLIENYVGRTNFDNFLKKYFSDYAFKSMDTQRFLEILTESFSETKPDLAEEIRLEDWVYGQGLPSNLPFKASARFSQVEEQINAWIAGISPDSLKTEAWSTHEWLHFIRTLPEALNAGQMAKLDKAFSFSRKNAEIQTLWYKRAIEADFEAAYPQMREFLIRVGRRKFLLPLYRTMLVQDREKELAEEIYGMARPNYHPITVASLDQLLNWQE